jgi:type IX secretion system PorP/SprF family membrane protein
MKKISLLLLLLLGRHVQAQFRPYALYDLSPVLTNPALVAADDYGQVTAHYRQSRGAGYRLPSLSYVHPVYGKVSGSRYGGLGFALINQSAGEAGQYRVTGAMGGFGYNVALGPHHSLTAGLQLGLVHKRIDPAAVTTDSQYDEGGFDPSLPTGESFDRPGHTAATANAGLHWAYTDRAGNRRASLGFALYHANRPAYPFLRERNREPVAYIATGSLLLVRRGRFSALPAFRYFREGDLDMGSIGTRFGHDLDAGGERKVSATLWYNTNAAGNFWPGVGLQLETEKFVLGLGADGSSLMTNQAGPGNGAFEVAVAWRVNRKKQRDVRHPQPEPIICGPGEEPRPLPDGDDPVEKAPAPITSVPQPSPAAPDSTPAPATPPPAPKAERLARRIAYPLGGTDLSAGDEQFLDSLARELKAHPDWQLRISGHTCSLGNPETNARVSLGRAQLVERRLMQKGLPPSQLRATGEADRYPIAPNDTEAGRAQNRRVEFVILN